MKIDDVLGDPFPENVQKVVDWLENQPKDEVFKLVDVSEMTGVDTFTIDRSNYLAGWCIDFPLGLSWYGSKKAIKEMKRKSKLKFGKKVLG